VPFGDSKRRHDQQRHRGEHHPDQGRTGLIGVEQIAGGFGGRVGGESEERHGDQAQGALLFVLGQAVELPHHDRAGEDLHTRIEPEADERDRPSRDPGTHGHDPFDRVPGDREPREQRRPTGQTSPVGPTDGERDHRRPS
jgi:hypothetical protein